jgi:hypothetical protein
LYEDVTVTGPVLLFLLYGLGSSDKVIENWARFYDFAALLCRYRAFMTSPCFYDFAALL